MTYLLLSWIACGEDPAESPGRGGEGESPAEEQELPSEYEYQPESGAEETLDVELIESALSALFAASVTLYPEPALRGYDSLMEQGDPNCPSWYEVDGNTFWYASCTAQSGASYDGYGFYYLYDDTDLFGDGALWDVDYLAGAATLEDNAGHSFHLGGDIYQGTGTAGEGDLRWVSAIFGSLSWDGESATGTWLAQGVRPSMMIYGISYPYGGSSIQYLYMDGTVADLSGGLSAVEVSDLTIGDEIFGFPCESEPAGAVAVRDEDGVWWDVIFDIDPESWELTGECDGCGAVFRGSELVGEACADSSVMLNWEEEPW